MSKLNKSVSLLMAASVLAPASQALASSESEHSAIVAAVQQSSKVSGTISDTMGAVIGASVVEKGTTNGTITDFDGKFSLDVPKGATLVISYVGYVSKEIKYDGQATLNITLEEDVKKLDEVVVTALGLKRSEKALGYAVTEVKGDELKAANTISPVAALQGKVAGVEISQSDGGIFGATKIQIRGASTLGTNNQPIYVIDGVILDNGTSGNDDLNWGDSANDYGNELKNLNPDDFETVSVLKGAAATALYGSRGLNGAIVITTKSGAGFKGLGVSVSQTFGIDHAYKTPGIQNLYGPGAYVGRTDADGNGNNWDPFEFQMRDGKPTLIGANGQGYGPRYDGRDIENYDGSTIPYSPQKNNMLDMYQTGFNTNTNVAVRGGNDKTSFYSSISYKHATSATPNNTFERYSFMVKASHKLSDRVDVTASVNFANSKPRNASKNIGEYFTNGTYNPLYNPSYFKDKYKGDAHNGLASTDYGDKYGSVPGKTYWFNINENDYVQKETVVRPTLELNIKITDWLKFKADANMNYYYNRGDSKVLGTGYANDGGEYKIWQNTKEQTTFGGTFSANKQINDFSLGGFARFEYYNNAQTNYMVRTEGGMVVPGQWFVENSKQAKISSGGIEGSKRMMSAIFALNVGWKNQLFLDVTGRNDWSSSLVYANGFGNYSYFYPSVSGSWLLSETFAMPAWVSLAKLRGSWAQVGNDTAPFTVNQAYGFSTIEMPNGNIFVNTLDKTMKSKSLKPERKNAWEIGMDFRTFNNRLNLDATYYKENTTDQIMSIAVPEISGVDKQLINAGNIQNQGVEIALNTIPYQSKDWEVGVDFTYTKNVSKIIELHPDAAEYIEICGQVNAYDYRVGAVAKQGGAYGMLMTDILPARDEQGRVILNYSDTRKAVYQKRSGVVEELGSMTPDFLGSMGANVRWKNLNLHVGLDMRIGGLVALYSSRYGTQSGWTESSLKYRDAEHGGLSWTSKFSASNGFQYNDGVIVDGIFGSGTIVTGIDGNKHDISGLTHKEAIDKGIIEPTHAGAYHVFANAWGEGVVNDNWVHELSYIALRDITLSYNLPNTWASKIGARSLGVSFSARNLGYLYNSLPNNVHPESVRGNVASEFRIRGYEPYIANYMFTINAEF